MIAYTDDACFARTKRWHPHSTQVQEVYACSLHSCFLDSCFFRLHPRVCMTLPSTTILNCIIEREYLVFLHIYSYEQSTLMLPTSTNIRHHTDCCCWMVLARLQSVAYTACLHLFFGMAQRATTAAATTYELSICMNQCTCKFLLINFLKI